MCLCQQKWTKWSNLLIFFKFCCIITNDLYKDLYKFYTINEQFNKEIFKTYRA